jgi:hypothetical protein
VGKAQYVAGAVAQDFQQQAGLAFSRAGAGRGGVGGSEQYPVVEPAQQFLADVGGDRGQVVFAGEVGVVD